MNKRSAIAALAGLIILGWLTAPAIAGDPSCKDLVIDSCTGCHGKERACANLGKSKKSWRSLIKFMISNGADLDDDEIEQLSDCMSEPAAGAVAACSDAAPQAAEKK